MLFWQPLPFKLRRSAHSWFGTGMKVLRNVKNITVARPGMAPTEVLSYPGCEHMEQNTRLCLVSAIA